MILAAALAWVVAALQLAAALPFLIEVIAGLPPARRRDVVRAVVPVPTVVLMPAHDEGRHIGAILAPLLPSLPPAMRLLVVADNCGDDTVAIARAAGAEVIERHDPARRGKGFALDFGRTHLLRHPPEVVVVLDADCRIAPDALVGLAVEAQAQQAAVQGLYLLEPRADAPAMVQVSSFAQMVKNLIRQRGLARLGAPVVLGGTGMAFPWELFRTADLGGGELVEDLVLSIRLARVGRPARFVEEARVWSDAASADATMGQRARWEGGFLAAARGFAPPMLMEGLRRGRPGLVWMGLHLATPPLALLMLLELAALPLVLALGWLGAAVGPVLLVVSVLAALGSAVIVAWGAYGRRWVRPGTLLRLPLYLLWKVPLYLKLLAGRGPRGWVRTERDG